MSKYNKGMISAALYDRCISGITTKIQAETVVEEVLNLIYRALLEGKEVNIPAIGILRTKMTKDRNARNPKTGEAVFVPAHRKVCFQQSERMKDSIKKVDSGTSIDAITY